MKKVLIIGCGYAGVLAAWRLSGHRKTVSVTVIDRSRYFNFLPLLPDTIGRKISPSHLAYPINALSSIYGFTFVNEEAKFLDLDKSLVMTSQKNISYDYLIIASGSETNFYGNEQIKKFAYKLDDAVDASKIGTDLGAKEFDAFVIGGGGYTGVEIATNLRVFLDRRGQKKRIVIVERAPSILGPLPPWMKDYVQKNLSRLNIEILTNTVIEKIEERSLAISGGQQLDNAMLIWAAGVKTADFLQNLNCEKNPQGRVKVDAHLKLKDNCFVIGDASYFQHQDLYLRMAVQFAIAQGSTVASNIIRHISSLPLRPFTPKDLGYLIPMANNRSCGNVLGRDIKGKSAIALHYLMCVYRAYGFKNKCGILKTLITGGGK
ncbi:MAG: FAD-dependent oxidoreductase [Candidatus Omnitrophota bacterium]